MPSFRIRARTTALALALLTVASACARHPETEDDEPLPRMDPIAVHVRNENFLDMNVYAVVGGMSRRLGTVVGNSSGDFSIDFAQSQGQSISLRAIPIGGAGSASTGSLNVGPGQAIEFRIAPVLRQSAAAVTEPPRDD